MTIFGQDLTTLAVVALLMGACGAGMGRLLWLMEGRPQLDRPAWWPRRSRRTPAGDDRAR